MLKNSFDANQPYQYVCYRRMSTDKQNPRSPNQQSDTIRETIKRLGFPWVHVADYTDNGISGLYIRKRPGLQQMLNAVRSGAIVVDLILVDTFERFGRAEECAHLRRDLKMKHGVLVLTADSQFSDPTSSSGAALVAIESIRSTEDGRIKSHNVLRGKRDAARLGHWPGGPAPFGYRLQSVLIDRAGRQEVGHCILVPDPETDWIIQRMFELAHDRGLGCLRLARLLNEDSSIPEKFKPFYLQTVNNWLKNPIYIGELHWEKHCTEVIDDVRRIERNPADKVVRVPSFCEPLVPAGHWREIQSIRAARGEKMRQARRAKDAQSGKLIKVSMPGIALKYLLSGLVRCAECNRSMVASSSPVYVTKAGVARRYVSYGCPHSGDQTCANTMRVKESWLRDTVVKLILRRLLPSHSDSAHHLTLEDLNQVDWFGPLLQLIQEEIDRQAATHVDRRPQLERHCQEIKSHLSGWTLTLAKHDLCPNVREIVEGRMGDAVKDLTAIERQLAEMNLESQQSRILVNPQDVVDRLNHLSEILASGDPTRANLELSLHVESIRCSKNGTVVVRMCKLGAFAGVVEQVLNSGISDLVAPSGNVKISKNTRRFRTLVRVRSADESEEDLQATTRAAMDINRFAHLGPEWFWEDSFQIPTPICWSEANAEKVAAKKDQTGWSLRKLATYFGKSKPTIAATLKSAAKLAKPNKDLDKSSGETRDITNDS